MAKQIGKELNALLSDNVAMYPERGWILHSLTLFFKIPLSCANIVCAVSALGNIGT